MSQATSNNQSKKWLWIIVIVLIILLCCCCVGAAAGGLAFFQLQEVDIEEMISSAVEMEPDDLETLVNPAEPEEETEELAESDEPENLEEPTRDVEDEEETIESSETVQEVNIEDSLLAITTSGVWLVSETTQEMVLLNSAPLDAPDDESQGLTPDRRYFAYLTGLETESSIPTLEVLDLAGQSTLFELELSSTPNQPPAEIEIGDPAFEALRAMSYNYSLAWSPDGQKLAFVAAIDGASSDVYLFDTGDLSVTRLTDEKSNAAALHWSPNGSYLQYVTIDSFGTGAGFSMDGVWIYDIAENQAKLVEQSQNSGEHFLAWQDDRTFFIYSWDAMCTEFNLRTVDASQLKQDVLVDGCFTAIAYDPQEQLGMFAITDFNTENCPCGKPMDAGLMIFGESVPLNGDNEHLRKFEYVIAYGIDFIPQGGLFTVYGDEGLQNIYNSSGSPVTIPGEVTGLKPYPAPQQESVWAWSSYYSGKTGLWIAENQQAPIELSPLFSGAPAWSNDGQRLYFYESNRLLVAEAPQYEPTSFVEIPGAEITALVK